MVDSTSSKKDQSVCRNQDMHHTQAESTWCETYQCNRIRPPIEIQSWILSSQYEYLFCIDCCPPASLCQWFCMLDSLEGTSEDAHIIELSLFFAFVSLYSHSHIVVIQAFVLGFTSTGNFTKTMVINGKTPGSWKGIL